MKFYHFYHPAMNIKNYHYPTRVCVCVCVLFCPADTVNPMILVNRSACKPLYHDVWKEHFYRNKEEGKHMLHAWTEEKYLYIHIFSQKT